MDSIENAYSYSLSEIRDMARKDNYVLNGAPAELILSLFQTPETIRSDHPVVVWQYRASSCVLDIYLSVGEDQAPQNVLYSEVRGGIRSRRTLCGATAFPRCWSGRFISRLWIPADYPVFSLKAQMSLTGQDGQSGLRALHM
ncbi:MAG: hypothetical protein IPO55_00180 [Alphaproteobacteria bacterium]|nr:hypothetical protein [Alphaproteobacteria bacterium]